MQTKAGGEDVVITTVLRSKDGNGTPLAVGSVIANVYTESAEFTPQEFLVRYAGPRTITRLANTGFTHSEWFGTTLLTLLGGVTVSILSRRLKTTA